MCWVVSPSIGIWLERVNCIMAFLGQVKKADLLELVFELGEEVPAKCTMAELKRVILNSGEYDEGFVQGIVKNITENRVQQEKLALEKEQREHEIKLKELEIKGREIELNGSSDGSERSGNNSNSFLAYLNIMKGTVLDPPTRPENWPFFFHHVEAMFKLYEVPQHFQGKIILHSLREGVLGIGSMLKEGEFDNYDRIKVVLKKFQITPLQHKRNFEQCFNEWMNLISNMQAN